MNKINPNDGHERWLPVVGFVGLYEVSNIGRIRSVERQRDDGRHTLKSKMLTPILNKGYPRVTMRRAGKTHYLFCHQMVAQAFIGPCPDGQEVRHKNGDRANPSFDNIEYGTRAQNIEDSRRHGTFKRGRQIALTADMARAIAISEDTAKTLSGRYGVSEGTIANIWSGRLFPELNLPQKERRSILTEVTVRKICKSHDTAAVLAVRYGVSLSTISSIRGGRTWRHVTSGRLSDYVKRGDEHPARRGKQKV